jgi:hypothetical protein
MTSENIVQVAIELSFSSWLVAVHLPGAGQGPVPVPGGVVARARQCYPGVGMRSG